MLRLGLPGCIMTWSEWFGWEANLFLAGTLCASDAAADGGEMAARRSRRSRSSRLMVISFFVHFGFSQAQSTLIGNAMGEGRWRDARRIAATGGTFVVSLATLAAAALVAGRHHAGALFVGDGADTAHLRALVARALPAVAAGTSCSTRSAPSFAHQTIFGLGVPLRLPAALNFVSFTGRRRSRSAR